MLVRPLLTAAVLLAVAAPPALAQTPSPAPYVNGPVLSTLVEGDTLYVGGTFTTAGTSAGPLSLVSPQDGSIVRSLRGFSGDGTPTMFNKPPMNANAVLGDGAGGWYVGGGFDRVDGQPRMSLVHLLPDGSVDPAFRADVLGTVTSLARHGSTLWVGGAFQEINGVGEMDLAAVDAATGTPLPVHPPSWGWIDDLVVSGDRLYVGSSDGLISLDARTGVRDDWRPEIYGPIVDIAVRDGIVYVAGRMERNWPGSDRQPGAVALRESDASLVTSYDVDTGYAIEPGDGVVVVRGTVYHRASERSLRAFISLTGAELPYFGDVISYGKGPIAISGSRVYFAGLSNTPGGFASYDLTTGARVPWSPPLAGGTIWRLAAANGVVAVAGYQMARDTAARNNLAAFDLRTGAVLPFAPEPRVKDGFFDPVATPMVTALARAGSLLYIGGRFDSVGGTPQLNLAAVDPVTGARSAFPDSTGKVLELAPLGGNLFVGGARGKLGGQQNDGLGALSLADGSVLAFAPALGCDVNALTVVGDTLHAGGCFGLRSFRDLTPVPGPAASGTIWSLLGDGAGGLYAGGTGGVAHLGAEPQGDVAVTDGPVYALAFDGTTLSVGGAFTRLQGAARANVGQVRDGSVTDFDPGPTAAVTALNALPGGMIIGGWMDSTRLATTAGLARFGDGTGVPPTPTPTATATPTASPQPTASPAPTATATPAASPTPTATATPATTLAPSASAPSLSGPRRAAAPAPTRVKIESATRTRVEVSVHASARGRQTVRVRLATGRRTVIGRRTVTLRAGVQTVRVDVRGHKGLRVRAEVGSARSPVRALRA